MLQTEILTNTPTEEKMDSRETFDIGANDALMKTEGETPSLGYACTILEDEDGLEDTLSLLLEVTSSEKEKEIFLPGENWNLYIEKIMLKNWNEVPAR